MKKQAIFPQIQYKKRIGILVRMQNDFETADAPGFARDDTEVFGRGDTPPLRRVYIFRRGEFYSFVQWCFSPGNEKRASAPPGGGSRQSKYP